MTQAVDRRSFLKQAVGGALVPSSVMALVASCTELDEAGQIVGPREPQFLNLGHGVGDMGPSRTTRGSFSSPRASS